MAARQPLVIVSGQIRQIDSADTLAVYALDPEVVSLKNVSGGSLPFGSVVYIISNNNIRPSRANAASTKNVIGLVASSSINNNAFGDVMTGGILEGTTNQWDAITGGSGGLIAGARYFVSNLTLGKMSSNAATSGYIVPVGYAISTTKFKIEIGLDIEL